MGEWKNWIGSGGGGGVGVVGGAAAANAAVFKDEIRVAQMVGNSVGRWCRFSRPRSLATTPKMRTAMKAPTPPLPPRL